MKILFRSQIFIFLLILSFGKNTQAKVILTTVPKCGTHLGIKCISQITKLTHKAPSKTRVELSKEDLSSPFIGSHAIWNCENKRFIEENNYRGVLILRDPRDQCLSFIHYAKKHPKAWPDITVLDFDDAVAKWIQNTAIIHQQTGVWDHPAVASFKGLDDFYDNYIKWSTHPSFYTTTFEKLVGPLGGGNKEVQLQEIINIAEHIGNPISRKEAEQIADNLFGKTATFRKGQIGSWKESSFFKDPKNKKLFKDVAGQLLIDLGYEKDMNW